ncbi:ERG2/sigma1 receptor-like protein [Pterulicium gracile]|uniref:C-8 sterol isomerase n=1 Tax=Pterulicium gracile TaxID=1884261 RepID=A0A5C3Q3C9_9AGAR|nr:ERG2/sigma1 receptor-like protein [Pterula gracilis]
MPSSKRITPIAQRKPKAAPRNFFVKWAVRSLFLVLFLAACSWLDSIRERFYVLDPKELHQLSQDAIAAHGNNTGAIIQHIVTHLSSPTHPTQSPKKIIHFNTDSTEWVFNNAGGAMGAMYIIHASITEYLIIFGTPLGTEGHSGLHTADDYFHILTGEQWAFEPGALEMERYTPGMVHLMRRGVAKQYKMHKGCFALEYARGWIPLMLPFGYADSLSSTLDYVTLYQTTVRTGREIIKNLLIGKI